MSQFELLSTDGEDIYLGPLDSAGKGAVASPKNSNILLSPLPGGQGLIANCSFGDMHFYFFEGEGFTIWKSLYDIRRPARVIGRTGQAVLELTSMYEGSFAIDWDGVVTAKLPLKQVELYYAPWVENRTQFQGPKQYLTMDVHFSPALLEPYAAEFPLLDRFLAHVHKGQPAQLFDAAQFASPHMNAVLKAMMEYQAIDSLAPRYYDSYVHILLILLLQKISGLAHALPAFSVTDLDKAHEARRLLTADYSASYTINQLSRLLGTNPYKLKTTFKHLFGMSIGKYKKTAFMEYARQLLLDTDNTIDEVAMLLGYNSQQSFTTAFKAHWGYTPGWMRRNK